MKNKINIRLIVLVCITLLVGFFRIWQTTSHNSLSNFTAIGAMALFGGCYFKDTRKTLLFPLLALFISDIILMKTVYSSHDNGLLYSGWWWVYGVFGTMVILGKYIIRKVNVSRVLLGASLAAIIHFLVGRTLGCGLLVVQISPQGYHTPEIS